MKILLAAGNYPSALEWLLRQREELCCEQPEIELRSVGYCNRSRIEISWGLESIFHPIYGKENKIEIESEIIQFAPDLILNSGELLIAKWAEKHSIPLWNCGGAEFFPAWYDTKFSKQKPVVAIIEPFLSQTNFYTCPVTFWPFLYSFSLKKEYDFCLPIVKEREILFEKGYLYLDSKIRTKLDGLNSVSEDVFVTDGSTYELFDALMMQVPKILIFRNALDPESVFNSLLVQKFNLAKNWNGEDEIDAEKIPWIDYEKLNWKSGSSILEKIKFLTQNTLNF